MDTLLTPAGGSLAALLSFRVGGLVWTAPVFSSRVLPRTVKSALTVLIVILVWRPPTEATAVRLTAETILAEVLIGMVLGLGAAIFVGAAESAGDMLAVQMGLSGANVVDPMQQTQLPVLGQFLSLFVVSLLLAGGGHLAMLEALGTSFQQLPPGTPIDMAAGIASVIRLGGTLLWLGLRFAAPVIAAMMIGNVALGIMARAVPQLNVLMVAFPVQIGIGLIVLSASLPLIAMGFADWSITYRGLASELVDSFVLDGRP